MVAAADSSIHPGLIPLERELRERLVWFIRMRWMAALAIFLGAWGITSYVAVGLSPLPLYGVSLAVAAYNVIFSILRRRYEGEAAGPAVLRRIIYTQIGLDWVSLICLVHYSGGLRSPVSLAFAFHITIGAILLSRHACYLQVLLAMLLSGGMLAAEQTGFWSPVIIANPDISPPCNLVACSFRWLVLSIFLAVTAYLTSSIIQPLRKKEEALFSSEKALEQAYQGMEALYQVGQAVNATLDLKQVLGLIVEHGARMMHMMACSIHLLDDARQHLRVEATFGLSQGYLDKGPVELSQSRIDAMALAGHTIQVTDVATDPRLQDAEEARREGIHALLCAPLLVKGTAIGCIRIYSSAPHQFSSSEENLLRNLGNLGAVAIDNARTYADLQTLSEERAWFARVTHHQLRSPLAAIKSLLDALRFVGELNEKQTDLVLRSQRRADELLDMIRDLLDLAAAQRPRGDLTPEPVVLLDCLAPTLETILDRAAHKGVLAEIQAADTEAAVRADVGDVQRIFTNLLDNAVKYTPRGGKVSLTIARENGQVLVTVQDSGIGIREEDQERVFEGFYRTDAAKKSGEVGTGMGLSIVKKLVARWGGTLTLRSAPGEGSKFQVRLPQGS